MVLFTYDTFFTTRSRIFYYFDFVNIFIYDSKFFKEQHGEISFEVQAAWRLEEVMTCSLFFKKKNYSRIALMVYFAVMKS